MKFKKAAVFLLCAALLFPLSLFAGAHQSLSGACEYSMSHGRPDELFSEDRNSGWKLRDGDNYINISLPRGRTTCGITVNWYSDGSIFSIKAYSQDNTELKKYVNVELYDGISCVYPLPEQTRVIRIDMTKTADDDEGIYSLCVCEAGSGEGMKWNAPDEGGLDLLVIPTHQDDEYIFLGGVIPMFINDGKSVGVAYAVNCGRSRRQEALRGLWKIKEKQYPDFLNFPDTGRLDSLEENIAAWGGEEYIVGRFVELIRKRRPKVVVTHDTGGEKYHSAHKTVAFAVQRAVKLAADPEAYPESAEKYGVWTVSKLYLHLAKENRIRLNYGIGLETYGGLDAVQVAAEGYEEHKSQQVYYQVKRGGKWDNSLFGLVYSTVGYDTYGFFYNISDSRYTSGGAQTAKPETQAQTTSRDAAAPDTSSPATSTPETTLPETEPPATETDPDTTGTQTLPTGEVTPTGEVASTGADAPTGTESGAPESTETPPETNSPDDGSLRAVGYITIAVCLAACAVCTAAILRKTLHKSKASEENAE